MGPPRACSRDLEISQQLLWIFSSLNDKSTVYLGRFHPEIPSGQKIQERETEMLHLFFIEKDNCL